MFKVIDLFTGETVEFTKQYDAESEAERRLSMHQNGYNIRRNHVSGCSTAVLKVNKNVYTIYNGGKL